MTPIEIKLTADVAELRKALAQAQADVKAMGNAAQAAGKQGAAGFAQAGAGATSLGDQIKASAAGMFIAQAAMQAIGQAVEVVKQRFQGFLDTGDRLSELSEKLGETVEWVSGMAYAADQSDTSLDAFANSAKKLMLNLDGADEEGKKATATFKRLGIDTKDAQGNTQSLATLLPQIADKVAGLESPIQKTAIATALFGKEGQTLVPLLNKGSAGIAELTAKAQAMGLIMSTEAAQAADKLKDKISTLNQVSTAGFNNAFASAAPQIEALIDLVTQLKTEGGNGNLLGGIIGSGADAIRDTIEGLRTIGAAFEPIIDLVKNLAVLLSKADETQGDIVSKTSHLRKMLDATALEIALIVDLFQKALGAVQYLGSAIITALVAPLSLALGVVGSIVSVFDKDVGAKLLGVANQANNYTASLRASAVATIQNANAVDTVKNKIIDLRREEAKRKTTSNDTGFKPKATGKLASAKGDDDANAAKAAADKAKQIADAQYQLTKTLLEGEQKLVDDALKDAQKAYDDAYSQGLISLKDYYTTRETIERTRLESLATLKDNELAEAVKRKAVSDKLGDVAGSIKAQTDVEKTQLDIVLNKAALDRLPAETTIAVRKAQAELDSAALKVDIEFAQTQSLVLDKGLLAASIREQYKALFDKFKLDPAMTAKLEAIVTVKLNKQSLEQDLAALDLANRANTQPLENKAALVQAQQQNGSISQPRAQAQLDVIKQEQIVLLQSFVEKLEAARAKLGDAKEGTDEFKQALDLDAKINGVKINLETLKGTVQDLGVTFENSLSKNLDAAFNSIVDGTKSAKQAFGDMAKAVIADVAKMIIKMLILKAINAAFGTSFRLADGGPVGASPQKLADGGSVHGAGGPRDDAIPAWLSNGEHVIDARTVAAFGGHGVFNALRALGNGRSTGAAMDRIQSVLGNIGASVAANAAPPNPRGFAFADGGAVAAPAPSQQGGNTPMQLVQNFHFASESDPRSRSQASAAAFAGAQRALQRNG